MEGRLPLATIRMKLRKTQALIRAVKRDKRLTQHERKELVARIEQVDLLPLQEQLREESATAGAWQGR